MEKKTNQKRAWNCGAMLPQHAGRLCPTTASKTDGMNGRLRGLFPRPTCCHRRFRSLWAGLKITEKVQKCPRGDRLQSYLHVFLIYTDCTVWRSLCFLAAGSENTSRGGRVSCHVGDLAPTVFVSGSALLAWQSIRQSIRQSRHLSNTESSERTLPYVCASIARVVTYPSSLPLSQEPYKKVARQGPQGSSDR